MSKLNDLSIIAHSHDLVKRMLITSEKIQNQGNISLSERPYEAGGASELCECLVIFGIEKSHKYKKEKHKHELPK